MKRLLAILVLAVSAVPSFAGGLVIPTDPGAPPLALVHHKARITIKDQVAETVVEQAFRNGTDRPLEATYLFPIPKDANVNKLTVRVNGKEQTGEVLDAAKAKAVYNEICRQTKDPTILEYVGKDLLRLKIAAVPAKKDVEVTIHFASIVHRDGATCEYVYPMKATGRAAKTLEQFSIQVDLQSSLPIQTVYSPTHALRTEHKGPKEVRIDFERNQATLDRDFHLIYGLGNGDVALTPVFQKPISGEDGYFLMLLSPRVDSPAESLPRDFVLVLDTSGSMDLVKMDQARKSLRTILAKMDSKDRFALISFSTNVRKYRDQLVEANAEHKENAGKWIDGLKANGGTAIDAALSAAADFRPKDAERPFTIVFFTDGQPTIGETKPEKILENAKARNDANTRIFTFGVGDDVNATMLDQLADTSRAVSTYVRPSEDIELKSVALYDKISHPVLTNLRLASSDNVRLFEIYPVKLPDLFHGGQLVVLGRYSGEGEGTVRLSGTIGKEPKEFQYPLAFPKRTELDREFVEHLWARRKVGFLLDQVRLNGERKELMDELLALAKQYGIATPYTSHFIMPDIAQPVAQAAQKGGFNLATRNPGGEGLKFAPPAAPVPTGAGAAGPGVLNGAVFGGGLAEGKIQRVEQWARGVVDNNNTANVRNYLENDRLGKAYEQARGEASKGDGKAAQDAKRLTEFNEQKQSLDNANWYFRNNRYKESQVGQVGVNLSMLCNDMRYQCQVTPTANRIVNGRNCLEVGGVWIDQAFDSKMKAVVVKAQSEAYFQLLEKQPNLKDAFTLGNYVVYVTPGKMALIIDADGGKEKLTESDLRELFPAK